MNDAPRKTLPKPIPERFSMPEIWRAVADGWRNFQAIPRKQRAMVRKGIGAGLVGELDKDNRRFFPIYSESVRNLGTPVFSRRLFDTLREVFGERCEVLTVTREHQAVASVMSFYVRDEVLPYYGGGGSLARSSSANDFMYWELMRRACERGIRVFDFGRSKRDTGDEFAGLIFYLGGPGRFFRVFI